MFNKIKAKNAFTLAEVLITLVIIGIVAALTIPTAINKYREQTLKSQFKKAYSNFYQAVRKTEADDFFGYARCYYEKRSGGGSYLVSSECDTFLPAFIKHLSVQKSCNGQALSKGCIPVYQSYNTSDGCLGFSENFVKNSNWTYVLSDGQTISIYANYTPIFLVDINGYKGPNAYGKDIFAFIVFKNQATSNITVGGGICEFPVEGGKTTTQMIKYSLAGIE